jgi:recombinational DNA repair ATPase RecF
MRVKNKNIQSTVQALNALDGNKDRMFKFSATTTYQLAKMLRRLKEEAETIEAARVNLLKKHGLYQRGQAGEADQAALAAFSDDYNQLIEAESDVTVTSFKLGEFNLETNQIPVSVLAAIDWLIIDEEKVGKADQK